MHLRRLVKGNALRALRRHWSRAAAISLILMILSQFFVSLEFLLSVIFDIPDFADPLRTPQTYLDDLPNAAPAAVALIGGTLLVRLILVVPLKLGTQRWFYQAGDGRPEETFAVFEYFSSLRLFLSAVCLNLQIILRGLFWTVIFLGPPGAVILFARMASRQAGTDFQTLLGTGLEAAGFLLLMLMSVFLAIRLMGYYLAPFAFAENPGAGACAAIRSSVRASRGCRWALLLFELSMIGWRFLELLVIPKLFTYPYRTTAQGLYAHFLFEKMRREEAEKQNRAVEKEEKEKEEQKEEEGHS